MIEIEDLQNVLRDGHSHEALTLHCAIAICERLDKLIEQQPYAVVECSMCHVVPGPGGVLWVENIGFVCRSCKDGNAP
jgi:hypothetical protein